VALKVLPPEFLHEETFAARFQREAKVVAKLEHPNIIPIFAFGIEDGIPWMAMRLISGGSLSGALKKGPLPRERSVAVIRAVADALTYAHAQGVVHRDVKPQNILLDLQGRVYLADFGIARMVEGGAAITRTGLVSGTPQYMAPEQATGHSLDHRVDVYALGVVAYEMFTGSAPFSADTPVAVLMKQVSAPIPIPPKEDVPEPLLGPLIKSLAKSPGERWQTAADFAGAIEKGLGLVATEVAVSSVASVPTVANVPAVTRSLPPQPPPPSRSAQSDGVPPTLPPPTDAKEPHRRAGIGAFAWWLGLGFAGLLATGAIAGFWVWQRPQAEPDPENDARLEAPLPVAEGVPAPPTTQGAPASPAAKPSRSAANPVTPVSPSTVPTVPRAPQPTPEARRMPTPALAAPSTTLAAEPEPANVTIPPTTPPARPAGHSFRLGERIDVGGPQVGPVTLLGVTFKATRPDEVEALLEFQCLKGKDQMVTYELSLLDLAGAPLLAIKGRKDVEENERATSKQKVRVSPGLIEATKSFRVSFSAVPD